MLFDSADDSKLAHSLFSCWLTYPLNRWLGRRGAIFWSTLCAGLGCICTYSRPIFFRSTHKH